MIKAKQFNNKLNNTFIKKEYDYLINEKYTRVSDKSYKNNNRFLKKCILKNLKNGEIQTIQKDIVKDFNRQKNNDFLKCKEIDRKRKELDYIPLFITLTNPSEFHPFISSEDKKEFISLNHNFKFLDLQTRITQSYININSIYREFYKNVKKRENKDMLYIKVIERHSSLIRHLHRIMYIKKNTYKTVKKQFANILKKHKLKQCKMKKLKSARGSSYIIKYLLKNYKIEEIKKLDGYKKLHKIQFLTSSHTDLNNCIFKKLYYKNEDLNNQVIKNIKDYNINKEQSIYQNLLDFYNKNTSIKKQIEDKLNLNKFDTVKRFQVFKYDIYKLRNVTSKEKKLIKKEVKTQTQVLKMCYKNQLRLNNTFYEIEKKEINKKGKTIYYLNKFENIINFECKRVKVNKNIQIFDSYYKKEIYNSTDIKLIKIN